MTVNVSQHPSSVENYIRHGWSLVPVPAGTKGPQHQGWNRRENALRSQAQLPAGWGIGLAHAYSGTMALDIDEWNTAAFELLMNGIDLHALYDAPDAVIVDSGRAGRGKLLYAMPFGLVLPSKKIVRDNKTLYELRCGTTNGVTVQDILPPTIHPSTNQPYRWAGKGHWTRLPVIPMPLLTLWHSLLVVPQQQTVEAPTSADWEEISDAMRHISPDCSRDEWVTVGMALHYVGTSTGHEEHAFNVWNEWSTPSDKYPGERELRTQWRSFRADKATKVRLGSLFRIAREAGWAGKMPDISKMFEKVEATSPTLVTDNLKPPPPELDFDLIPNPVRQVAIDVSESIGCDPLVPMFAAFAAVSGAVDARTRLELLPGFKVPPILWIMTIGDPADKKTPGSAPLFNILRTLEQEDRPRYKQALQQFEGLEVRHQEAKKAFLDAAKDPEALLSGEMPAGYGDAPKPPAPLRIVMQDVSSQKLVRVAADNPRGLLCYLDEMNSWVQKITDPRTTEAISTWTTGYESAYYKMDRVGAGEIEADNYALSMYGNIQPRVFSAHVSKMSEDGLLQRFIPVNLRGHMTRLGSPSRDRQASLGEYEMKIRALYGLPALTYGMSADAQAKFVEFQKWYHTRLKDERLLKSNDVYLQAFGKLEGLTGRLILILHLLTNPYKIEVDADTVDRAVEIVTSYIVPSMRYTYNGDLANNNSFDKWIMEYVIQYADKQTLTLADIRAGARRQIDKMSRQVQIDSILAAMYPLEKSGWVARLDDGGREHQGQAQWAVNPSLMEQFKEHRRNVIEAKQRMMDHVFRDATKRKPKVHGYEEAA
jgi:hypothetical protein